MSPEILASVTTSQVAGGSLIGDRGLELLHLICLSSKPISTACRISPAK